MTQFNQKMDAVVSNLTGDVDMADLLEMFVLELPKRVEAIHAAMSRTDMDGVSRLAHQLKGAAGGYGFPTISQAAMSLERLSASAADLDQIQAEINALTDLCRRAVIQPSKPA